MYCGKKPKINKALLGLDRLNNDLGYIKNNIGSCCKECNLMKNKLNYEEFIIKIRLILHNQGALK